MESAREGAMLAVEQAGDVDEGPSPAVICVEMLVVDVSMNTELSEAFRFCVSQRPKCGCLPSVV